MGAHKQLTVVARNGSLGLITAIYEVLKGVGREREWSAWHGEKKERGVRVVVSEELL